MAHAVMQADETPVALLAPGRGRDQEGLRAGLRDGDVKPTFETMALSAKVGSKRLPWRTGLGNQRLSLCRESRRSMFYQTGPIAWVTKGPE